MISRILNKRVVLQTTARDFVYMYRLFGCGPVDRDLIQEAEQPGSSHTFGQISPGLNTTDKSAEPQKEKDANAPSETPRSFRAVATMPPARTDGVTWPSGRIGQQGPSLSAVMSLNVSQPPTLLSGMSPRPQPPLQRIRRPMVGSVVPREEVECTLSHIKQLRQREKQRKREARDSRRDHRKNMRDLVDSFEGGLEETAARNVWAQDISSQQEEQRVSKVRRDIEDHRFFYSESNFFPFESKQGKPGIYDSPAVHSDKLLLQAEEDRRRDALRLMVEGVKNSNATGILASSLPADIPRGVASVAAAFPRQEAEHRNATRRAVEQRLKMVQQQQQKERFNARMMDNLERKQREDANHERRNQKQLEKAHIII